MKSVEQRKREIARAQAATPKPKPAPILSGWDDPNFGERVLARVARTERAKNQAEARALLAEQPRAATSWFQSGSSVSAKSRWEAAVDQIAADETNGDRTRAKQIAKSRHSGLLRQMMTEANQ